MCKTYTKQYQYCKYKEIYKIFIDLLKKLINEKTNLFIDIYKK